MSNLAGRTLFITGGSRGIGLAIALAAAHAGANVAIAAKTTEPHPKLPGTIYTAAEEIEAAGGHALPLKVDVRDADQIEAAVAKTADHFGRIDICVNNASAIHLANTLDTPVKRYDLMHQINVRGSFLVSRACLPHLLKSDNPHILFLSPPLDLQKRWFVDAAPYALSKFGMSMNALALSAEYAGRVAVNALWPRTTIDTAAIRNIVGDEQMIRRSRKPDIMADAALRIFAKPKEFSGHFLIDDEFLAAEGVTDFDKYAVDPSAPLQVDFFVPDNIP